MGLSCSGDLSNVTFWESAESNFIDNPAVRTRCRIWQYTRYMDDVDPAAKAHPLKRFATEAQRLMGVLSRQLEGQEWVCGERFSIADIAIYPWVRGWKWSKIPIVDIPNLEDWVARVRARPGVGRGLAYGVPESEVDQWSAARKAQVAAGGSSMAATSKLNRDSPAGEGDASE